MTMTMTTNNLGKNRKRAKTVVSKVANRAERKGAKKVRVTKVVRAKEKRVAKKAKNRRMRRRMRRRMNRRRTWMTQNNLGKQKMSKGGEFQGCKSQVNKRDKQR